MFLKKPYAGYSIYDSLIFMAKNKPLGDNARVGAVRNRSQFKNPVTDLWVKRDDITGQFMDNKTSGGFFKGVRKK